MDNLIIYYRLVGEWAYSTCEKLEAINSLTNTGNIFNRIKVPVEIKNKRSAIKLLRKSNFYLSFNTTKSNKHKPHFDPKFYNRSLLNTILIFVILCPYELSVTKKDTPIKKKINNFVLNSLFTSFKKNLTDNFSERIKHNSYYGYNNINFDKDNSSLPFNSILASEQIQNHLVENFDNVRTDTRKNNLKIVDKINKISFNKQFIFSNYKINIYLVVSDKCQATSKNTSISLHYFLKNNCTSINNLGIENNYNYMEAKIHPTYCRKNIIRKECTLFSIKHSNSNLFKDVNMSGNMIDCFLINEQILEYGFNAYYYKSFVMLNKILKSDWWLNTFLIIDTMQEMQTTIFCYYNLNLRNSTALKLFWYYDIKSLYFVNNIISTLQTNNLYDLADKVPSSSILSLDLEIKEINSFQYYFIKHLLCKKYSLFETIKLSKIFFNGFDELKKNQKINIEKEWKENIFCMSFTRSIFLNHTQQLSDYSLLSIIRASMKKKLIKIYKDNWYKIFCYKFNRKSQSTHLFLNRCSIQDNLMIENSTTSYYSARNMIIMAKNTQQYFNFSLGFYQRSIRRVAFLKGLYTFKLPLLQNYLNSLSDFSCFLCNYITLASNKYLLAYTGYTVIINDLSINSKLYNLKWETNRLKNINIIYDIQKSFNANRGFFFQNGSNANFQKNSPISNPYLHFFEFLQKLIRDYDNKNLMTSNTNIGDYNKITKISPLLQLIDKYLLISKENNIQLDYFSSFTSQRLQPEVFVNEKINFSNNSIDNFNYEDEEEITFNSLSPIINKNIVLENFSSGPYSTYKYINHVFQKSINNLISHNEYFVQNCRFSSLLCNLRNVCFGKNKFAALTSVEQLVSNEDELDDFGLCEMLTDYAMEDSYFLINNSNDEEDFEVEEEFFRDGYLQEITELDNEVFKKKQEKLQENPHIVQKPSDKFINNRFAEFEFLKSKYSPVKKEFLLFVSDDNNDDGNYSFDEIEDYMDECEEEDAELYEFIDPTISPKKRQSHIKYNNFSRLQSMYFKTWVLEEPLHNSFNSKYLSKNCYVLMETLESFSNSSKIVKYYMYEDKNNFESSFIDFFDDDDGFNNSYITGLEIIDGFTLYSKKDPFSNIPFDFNIIIESNYGISHDWSFTLTSWKKISESFIAGIESEVIKSCEFRGLFVCITQTSFFSLENDTELDFTSSFSKYWEEGNNITSYAIKFCEANSIFNRIDYDIEISRNICEKKNSLCSNCLFGAVYFESAIFDTDYELMVTVEFEKRSDPYILCNIVTQLVGGSDEVGDYANIGIQWDSNDLDIYIVFDEGFGMVSGIIFLLDLFSYITNLFELYYEAEIFSDLVDTYFYYFGVEQANIYRRLLNWYSSPYFWKRDFVCPPPINELESMTEFELRYLFERNSGLKNEFLNHALDFIIHKIDFINDNKFINNLRKFFI
uniref:Uncharacterized protein n=1 Tax=Amorphochlora amoebiformis TaxID=1561963 RepID=A0A0H5BLM6_9EUKA|nr:hypothetical protein [Amorphochlora amoebiformis]